MAFQLNVGILFLYLTAGACGNTSDGCFGRGNECHFHKLTCGENEKIGINKAFYINKNNASCETDSISCSSDLFKTCCSDRTQGTEVPFSEEEFQTLTANCSFVPQCKYRAKRTKTTLIPYSVLDYTCFSENVVEFCGGQGEGTNHVTLAYNSKRAQTTSASLNCFCTVNTVTNDESSTVTNISVFALDMRMKTGASDSCTRLSIDSGSNVITYNCCTTFNPYQLLATKLSHALNIHLEIADHSQPIFLWMQITGDSRIKVTCTDKDVPTTSESSSPSPDPDTHGMTGTPVGAILGAVVAVIAVTAGLVFIVFFIRKRRNLQSTEKTSLRSEPTYSVAGGNPKHTTEQHNYDVVEPTKRLDSDYDLASDLRIVPLEGQFCPKQTACNDQDYDLLKQQHEPGRKHTTESNYDVTTASSSQNIGNTNRDDYGYHHLATTIQKPVALTDYDTVVSAARAVEEIERGNGFLQTEDNYDHFEKNGTSADQKTVDKEYDTTANCINDTPFAGAPNTILKDNPYELAS